MTAEAAKQDQGFREPVWEGGFFFFPHILFLVFVWGVQRV